MTGPIRIAFFGTPDVALPALQALLDAPDVEVMAVVTNPDRPKGRSRTPVASPVKQAALAAGIDVLQPNRPVEIVDALEAMQLDACAIVAYGALLARPVLDAGGSGFVNLHFSLLPRWRGAAPVQHALRAGDEVIGVTCFVLDEGMDTGPVLRTGELPIAPEATAGDLLDELATIGAPLLLDAVRALVAGEQPTPQADEGVTLAPKVTPEDVRIDWHRPARELADLVRSANPAPGAHTTFDGERLKIWRARPIAGVGEAGVVADRVDDGPVVGTGDGLLVLTQVQPAGKPRMSGAAFANGYQPLGGRLGS
ncbi:MAG TPA: methionyl-tRNA formyltransferase [Nitriliruptorales bacterium]